MPVKCLLPLVLVAMGSGLGSCRIGLLLEILVLPDLPEANYFPLLSLPVK